MRVVRAAPEDGELLLDVAVEGEEDGEGGHEDVLHEVVDEGRERGGDAVLRRSANVIDVYNLPCPPRPWEKHHSHHSKGDLEDTGLEGKVGEAAPKAAGLLLAAVEERIFLAVAAHEAGHGGGGRDAVGEWQGHLAIWMRPSVK